MRASISLLLALAVLGLAVRPADAQSAKAREKQGRAYLAAQKWDDAIVELDAALAAEPARIAIYFALARAYEGKGDEQRAIDAYARYPENGPDAAEARTEITRLTAIVKEKSRLRAEARASQGQAFHDNGAYDQAVAEYLEAYRLSPTPLYYFLAGRAYEAKGDKRKAIELYQQYLDADAGGARAAEAQQLIARLARDLASEVTAGARKAEAEIAAGQARDAADAARRAAQSATDASAAGDTAAVSSHVTAVRSAASDAATAAAAAERAALAAEEASTAAATTDAQLAATEARRLATDARRAATEAGASLTSAEALGTPTTPLVTERPAPSPARPGRALRWSGIGVAAGGVACVAAGVFFGFQAASADDDISSASDEWTTDLDQAVISGQADQRTMYILYGIGGALVGGGIALYVLGSRSGAAERTPITDARALRWTPVLTPSHAGAAVVGRF